MTTLRNMVGLALIMMTSMFGGVGCLVATNADTYEDEVESVEDESQDSADENDINPEETEDTDSAANNGDGVCAPPCTKI